MKQYFSYFKYLYIALAVVIVASIAVYAGSYFSKGEKRKNLDAPTERVYDFADVLTDQEEEKLRTLIARKEKAVGVDIVLVTINQSVLEYYGYSENTDINWVNAMMNYADDFYDENSYGFDMVHGDGVLLLDNWYEGEKGSWLSTCGEVYRQYSNVRINVILDKVYEKIEESPYEAYKIYVESIRLDGRGLNIRIGFLTAFGIPAVAAAIYVFSTYSFGEGKKTTSTETYLSGGEPNLSVKTDQLVNKFVTSRTIQSSSSGGRSSGGGGGHTSRGGVRHGGGGRRR